jgi:hypothetical protein
MTPGQIPPHEPDEELIGPDELARSVANLESAMSRARVGSLQRALSADPRINNLVQAVIRAGVCRDEGEVIRRAVETFCAAVLRDDDRRSAATPRSPEALRVPGS